MAMVDIQSLFADIIESPRQRQQAMAEMGQRDAQIATNALSGRSQIFAPLVGALAKSQGTRGEMLERSVGGLFGLDTRNESEKLQQMLSSAQTPEQQAQLPAMLRQMGYGQQAMALEQQLAASAQAQEDRALTREVQQAQLAGVKAETQRAALAMPMAMNQRIALTELVSASDMPEAKRRALMQSVAAGGWDDKADELYKVIYPEGSDDLKTVGNAIYDVKNGAWLTPPAAALNISDFLSSFDPDNWDAASVADYGTAVLRATTEEERMEASRLLRPKPDPGTAWVQGYNENNEVVQVQRPIEGSSAYREVQREVDSANATGERTIRVAENAVTVTDKLIDALSNNKVETGISGAILRYFPETGEADFQAGLDTVLANLGINELSDIRAAAANGASGFGQLTQRELDRLESRLRSLSQKQSRGAMIENLTAIRNELALMQNKSKTDWTFDEWLGIAPRPQSARGNTVTTPSGTYTIEAIE
jgi:hypothetical protein